MRCQNSSKLIENAFILCTEVKQDVILNVPDKWGIITVFYFRTRNLPFRLDLDHQDHIRMVLYYRTLVAFLRNLAKRMLLVFRHLMIYLTCSLFIYIVAVKDTWVYFITLFIFTVASVYVFVAQSCCS